MRTDKYGRELELILLLSNHTSMTTQQIAEKTGMTRRNIYFYFERLKDYGFKLIKNGVTYRLDRRSPFFMRLHENISLSEYEASVIIQQLSNTGSNSVNTLIVNKLKRYHNLPDANDPEEIKKLLHIKNSIKKAIDNKKLVRFTSYSSPHSRTVTDRVVEPFLFVEDSIDVRCYEISTHTNKTFKMSRMKDAEVLDIDWFNEKKHKDFFTDIFTFSGEERFHIKLLLGQLAHNLILEEYPLSESYITQESEEKWILETDVVSFLAPGRFVLGLFDDVKVLGNNEFKRYLAQKIDNMVRF